MCTSNCRTKNHASWGECVRAKNMRVAYCRSAFNQDFTAQKRWDNDLDSYASARRQGMQPDSTYRADVDRAVRISNDSGEAYGYSGGA